jgi:DNA phosphorothioation-associated putative methyltransferase
VRCLCDRPKAQSLLRALGFEACGWDPAYFTTAPKEVADVGNLGYVINVIESSPERVAVLVDAWRYTREALVISTMVRGQEPYDSVRDHADGVLTSRNTFQKYFEPSEIQGLIETALVLQRPFS